MWVLGGCDYQEYTEISADFIIHIVIYTDPQAIRGGDKWQN